MRKKYIKTFILPAFVVLLLAQVVAVPASLLLNGKQASAAPRTPQEASVIYAEDFENVANPPTEGVPNSGTLEALWQSPSIQEMTPMPEAYEGATGMTYTSNPDWTNPIRCNGMIMSELTANFLADMGPSYPSATGVCLAGTFDGNWDVDHLRNTALAIGMEFGQSGNNPGEGASINHVLSAVSRGSIVAPAVTFETVDPIALTNNGPRFLTFTTDIAAISCNRVSDPLLTFSLLDYTNDPSNPDEISVFGNPINPCTDPRGEVVDLGEPYAAANPRVGRYAPAESLLFDGSSVGLRLLNDQGGGSGNDFASDNIRLLDASPHLDKEFADGEYFVGDTIPLTFTITNTAELAAKEGWSFTDSLHPNLTIADDPAIQNSCSNSTVVAQPGSSAVEIAGDLETDQAYCEVTVNVTADEAGAYENGAVNITEEVGIVPPEEPVVVEVSEPQSAEQLAPTGQNTQVYIMVSSLLMIASIGFIARRKIINKG